MAPPRFSFPPYRQTQKRGNSAWYPERPNFKNEFSPGPSFASNNYSARPPLLSTPNRRFFDAPQMFPPEEEPNFRRQMRPYDHYAHSTPETVTRHNAYSIPQTFNNSPHNQQRQNTQSFHFDSDQDLIHFEMENESERHFFPIRQNTERFHFDSDQDLIPFEMENENERKFFPINKNVPFKTNTWNRRFPRRSNSRRGKRPRQNFVNNFGQNQFVSEEIDVSSNYHLTQPPYAVYKTHFKQKRVARNRFRHIVNSYEQCSSQYNFNDNSPQSFESPAQTFDVDDLESVDGISLDTSQEDNIDDEVKVITDHTEIDIEVKCLTDTRKEIDFVRVEKNSSENDIVIIENVAKKRVLTGSKNNPKKQPTQLKTPVMIENTEEVTELEKLFPNIDKEIVEVVQDIVKEVAVQVQNVLKLSVLKDKEEYHCEVCGVYCSSSEDFETHNESATHQVKLMAGSKSERDKDVVLDDADVILDDAEVISDDDKDEDNEEINRNKPIAQTSNGGQVNFDLNEVVDEIEEITDPNHMASSQKDDVKWNPDIEVGKYFLVQFTGYFCKACKKYYYNDENAKDHCKSLTHFENCNKILQWLHIRKQMKNAKTYG